jgi:hypothetical protein
VSGKYWGALFSKLLAIYVLIGCINYLGIIVSLPVTITGAELWEKITMALSYLISFVLRLALAYFLWAGADYLSGRMVGDNGDDVKPATPEDVQAIAFSAVGVLVLSDALPELLQQLTSLIAMRQMDILSASDWMYISSLTKIAGLVLKAVMGLWLFLGSRGMVQLFRRMRKAGVKTYE